MTGRRSRRREAAAPTTDSIVKQLLHSAVIAQLDRDPAVGWAKARSAVPTVYRHACNGGHASLCPPYGPDCVACARKDAERHTCSRSRRAMSARVLPNGPPRKQRVQGKPGAQRTHSLVCKVKGIRVVHYRSAETTGLPCAMVYGLLRDLPGETELFCHRHRRNARSIRQLGTCVGAPEPHGFAVRNVRRSSDNAIASTTSRLAFRDDA
jgi:hypothetical protein